MFASTPRRYGPWLVLVAALAGCGDTPPRDNPSTGARLKVVCTTGQVGDMLSSIGGDRAAVHVLMGPGVDPHLYKATPGDRRWLNSADVIFYSGLHLEGRLASLLEKLAEQKPVFAVTDGLRHRQERSLRKVPGAEGAYDPHLWFDVSLWAQCTDYAAEKLAEVDPAHAAHYRRGAEAYRAELEALHRWCQAEIGQIPKARRVLVTAHDAFGYFGRAYDIEVHGLQGISTTDEADLAGVNQLVELLVARGIKAVFVESSVPPRNIQALVQGCAARGHTVSVGGELYSDALGPAGTPEASYIGVVKHNVTTIVQALK